MFGWWRSLKFGWLGGVLEDEGSIVKVADPRSEKSVSSSMGRSEGKDVLVE